LATDTLSDALDEDDCCGERAAPLRPSFARAVSSPVLSTLSAVAVAFFPKCPMCWAAYLSLFGVAGVEWLSASPWLLPLLVLVMLVNVGSLWWIGRRSRRRIGFYLAALGALTIVVFGLWLDVAFANAAGIVLTGLGSLFSVGPLRVGRRARGVTSEAALPAPAPPGTPRSAP
jgi:protein SCO1